MSVRIRSVEPHPHLKGVVERLFVFESDGQMPDEDLKLIVPNGLIKLVIPFRNGLLSRTGDWTHLAKENSLAFIGISEIPARVDLPSNGFAGNITLEFSPWGAYRLFPLRLGEVKNQVHALTDLMGVVAGRLAERLAEAEDLGQKVQLVQQFLLGQLRAARPDPVFDHCIQRIVASRGRIAVGQLEKETGYSSRWLLTKFHERLGISPKSIASVIRFQQLYKALSQRDQTSLLPAGEFYEYYYDQSHFIKDFKKFTGLAPTRFVHAANAFDSVFYQRG